MIFLIVSLLLIVPWSISAPTAGSEHVSWQSSPNVRGTWELLISCTFTLVVCVYTTVHLNLPGDEPVCWRCRLWRRMRKPRWIVTGIFAPEIVVYTAWRQWVSARALTKKMEGIRRKRQARGLPPSKHEWTIIHSFFAGMGGFVIDTGVDGEPEGLAKSPSLALTAKGVLQLASLGYDLPDVSLQSIKDRSKADTFTKGIACLQAGYMIFQLVGRLVGGLFITLLEVNAVGHALCALILFWFWLRKPYDIKSPITVAGTWVGPVAALWSLEIGCDINDCSHNMDIRFMRPRHDMEEFKNFIRIVNKPIQAWAAAKKTGLCAKTTRKDGKTLHGDIEKVNFEGVQSSFQSLMFREQPFIKTRGFVPSSKGDKRPGPLVFARMPTAEEKSSWKVDTDIAIILCESPIKKTNSEIELKLSSSPLWSNVTHVYRSPLTSSEKGKAPSHLSDVRDGLHWLDDATLRQWELAAAALEMERDCSVCPLDAHQPTTECLVPRVGNFPYKSGLLPPSRESYIEIAIALSTALYGGIHMSQWSSDFPSQAEAELWRWATVIVAGSGFIAGLAMMAHKYHNTHAGIFTKMRLPSGVGDSTWRPQELASRKDWTDSSSPVKIALKFCLACTASVLLACVYIPARCFVVIEAFISLRSLPVDAYKTPDSSQWIPHI